MRVTRIVIWIVILFSIFSVGDDKASAEVILTIHSVVPDLAPNPPGFSGNHPEFQRAAEPSTFGDDINPATGRKWEIFDLGHVQWTTIAGTNDTATLAMMPTRARDSASQPWTELYNWGNIDMKVDATFKLNIAPYLSDLRNRTLTIYGAVDPIRTNANPQFAYDTMIALNSSSINMATNGGLTGDGRFGSDFTPGGYFSFTIPDIEPFVDANTMTLDIPMDYYDTDNTPVHYGIKMQFILSGQAVPEPNAAMLLFVGGAFLFSRRLRQKKSNMATNATNAVG